jgi:hypothetical protein
MRSTIPSQSQVIENNDPTFINYTFSIESLNLIKEHRKIRVVHSNMTVLSVLWMCLVTTMTTTTPFSC